MYHYINLCDPVYVILSWQLYLLDKNECLDRSACGNGVCHNLVGSFECKCDKGYEPGDNMKCEGKT